MISNRHLKQAVLMKKTYREQPMNKEKGNILIICVVIIMILTSLGIYGLNSTSVELAMSGSDKRESTNFQNAEAGLKFAIAHFKLIHTNDDNTGNPLYRADANGTGIGGNLSVVGGQLIATDTPAGTLTPLRDMAVGSGGVRFNYINNNIPIALIEIRDIARNPINIVALSTFANSVPAFPHLSDAPSGYDSSQFYGRNYCITSTALDSTGAATSNTVQCGIKIAAYKDTVADLITL
jgi:hypothetical protein